MDLKLFRVDLISEGVVADTYLVISNGNPAPSAVRAALELSDVAQLKIEEVKAVTMVDDGTHHDPETVKRAQAEYPGSDDIKIDDDARVSLADDGDWVEAWVWIAHPDEPETPTPQGDGEDLYNKLREVIEEDDMHIPEDADDQLGEVCRMIADHPGEDGS
jgi:hypothetical protein